MEVKKLASSVDGLKEKILTLEESKAANALVDLYASRPFVDLDMKTSLRIFSDQTFHSPIFCHDKLPIILSHFIKGLDSLPNGLNAMPSILIVRDSLLSSFKRLVECDIPVTKDKIKHFKSVLEEIEDSHAQRELLQTMAVGILELREHLSRHRRALVQLKNSSSRWARIPFSEKDILPYDEVSDIQEPLNSCNRCMILYNFLSRMLLNVETVDECEPGAEEKCEKRVGMVDLEIDLELVVRNAVDEAKQVCTDFYGDCPDVKFLLSTDSKKLAFPYMSTTIRYIVIELMKNAFRATVEAHMKKDANGIVTCEGMPPVEVLICLHEGTQHASIRISDEGLGMSVDAMNMAMAYSYTSVRDPAIKLAEDGTVTTTDAPSPLAGYGYGLPMSRVYAQSFGGDLTIQSMEGYGTRAFFFIKMT